jgi:hypothetical protein
MIFSQQDYIFSNFMMYILIHSNLTQRTINTSVYQNVWSILNSSRQPTTKTVGNYHMPCFTISLVNENMELLNDFNLKT